MERGACSSCICNPRDPRSCRKPPTPSPSLRKSVAWPQPPGTNTRSPAPCTQKAVPLRGPPRPRAAHSAAHSESSECCPSGAKREREGGVNAQSLLPHARAFHTGPCECIGTPDPRGPTKPSTPPARHSRGITSGALPTIATRERMAEGSRGRLKSTGRWTAAAPSRRVALLPRSSSCGCHSAPPSADRNGSRDRRAAAGQLAAPPRTNTGRPSNAARRSAASSSGTSSRMSHGAAGWAGT
eukprot:scaffold6008_cov118-Isochrysis_galbana.AAC.5